MTTNGPDEVETQGPMGTAASLIAPATIDAAVKRIAESDGLASRLEWWLQGGHSTEKWIQFELAYRLQEVVGRGHIVICEQGQIDITFVPSDFRSKRYPWNDDPVAAIELKWWGNWWIDAAAITKLKADVAKVENCKKWPSVALLLLLRADVDREPRAYQWIGRQIEDHAEVSEPERLLSTLEESIGRKAHVGGLVPVPPTGSLTSASLQAIGFYNAKGAPDP